MIIGRLVSLPGRRLAATIGALWLIGVNALNVAAGAVPDSTWVSLQPLPGQGRTALFALAVDPFNNQVVVAANSQGSLLRTNNGGSSWTTARAGKTTINTLSFSPNTVGLVLAGTMTLKLTAGPLPPVGNIRPLLVGTNTGLFASNDNGASFNPLSGGGLLPTTDYTQVAFITTHFDRFYAASDGGGAGSGGLWRTNDAGQTFTSLRPPQAAVTALAVSNDEQPRLYVATFQPATHLVSLWTYHDTGGTPVGPPPTESSTASGSRAGHTSEDSTLGRLLSSPQLPYIGLGLGALAVVLTAIAAHLRGRYR